MKDLKHFFFQCIFIKFLKNVGRLSTHRSPLYNPLFLLLSLIFWASPTPYFPPYTPRHYSWPINGPDIRWTLSPFDCDTLRPRHQQLTGCSSSHRNPSHPTPFHLASTSRRLTSPLSALHFAFCLLLWCPQHLSVCVCGCVFEPPPTLLNTTLAASHHL